ncbi:spermidine synthase [Zoogloeaceae bacteirum Par-f-2]|uniref:spermine/spermidine synthase domain-containing protein n=1 Tax=Pseudothauera hydrothermalis TaxID=2184083 RepID=UPI000C7D4AD9|nr:spermidine synthase [Pseudothauera hydrothermalis]AUL99958.1 spermidine synthase [Rhodocyclaceae bacterium]AVZ79230.1 spermidine synthase [Zoogloeaceae bacteirum Par-f-2]
MSTPIDISEKAGVRYLHFGSEWIQGAMRIRRPNALELAYTREMMAGLVLRAGDGWPKTALVIGLGAASLTKFLYHHYPHVRIQVVEIEPRVVAAARQCFRLPEPDTRLALHIGCGADYVFNTTRHFDYILVDGYDRNARAGVLDTLPFYQAARSRLSDTGLIAVNLFGRARGFAASVERIVGAFDDRAIAFPSCDSGNVVAFGAAGEPIVLSVDELRERARQLKVRTGMDLVPTITRLEQAGSLPGGRLVL